ncbi:alginate O-acetyltransferase AlgF [Roseivivax sp. CAU 1761]
MTIRPFAFAGLLGTAAAALAQPAMAQDDSLYPEPSAPDASFLRMILPEDGSAEIDGAKLAPVAGGVTAYTEVAPGTVEIEVGGETATVEVGANQHYTWTAEGGTPALIEDAVKDSPAQADLLIYNLSQAGEVDLYAVEAETEALSDVAAGGHQGVGLKAPLTLTFEVRQDDRTLAALDPVDLRRGAATTIVVRGAPDAVEASAMDSVYE